MDLTCGSKLVLTHCVQKQNEDIDLRIAESGAVGPGNIDQEAWNRVVKFFPLSLVVYKKLSALSNSVWSPTQTTVPENVVGSPSLLCANPCSQHSSAMPA